MTASQQPTGHDKAPMNTPTQAATLARTRVIAANEALITAGLRHQPQPNTYHHAPYCEQGDRCCCTQAWVRLQPTTT